MTMNMNRREAIATAAAATGILVAQRALAGEPAKAAAGGAAAPATPGFEPKPLPFDPKKLTGISEKLITSHHDNNYAGAVKNLGKVREQIAATNKDTPAFVVAGLREKEL